VPAFGNSPIPTRSRNQLLISRDQLCPDEAMQPRPGTIACTWEATTEQAGFDIPTPLAAGWIQIRFRLRRPGMGRVEREVAQIFAGTGNQIDRNHPLEQFIWDDLLHDEAYLHLDEPVDGLRFEPMEGRGRFVIDEVTIRPLSQFGSVFHAIARKYRLVRNYHCVGAASRRALKDVLTFRWGRLANKLFRGLPDTRRLKISTAPDFDVAAARSRRKSLPESEQTRLRAEAEKLVGTPLLELLIIITSENEDVVVPTIESLQRQVDPNWHATILFSGRVTLENRGKLDGITRPDDRFRVIDSPMKQTLEESLRILLDEITVPYVAFVHPGYDLSQMAVLRLRQEMHHHPELIASLNRARIDDRPLSLCADSEVFRPGQAGQQVNLFQVQALRNVRDWSFPTDQPFWPGNWLSKHFLSASEITFLPEPLSFFSSHFVPVQDLLDPKLLKDSPTPWMARPPLPNLFLTGDLVGISGWDYVFHELARGLNSVGASVWLNPISKRRPDLVPPELLHRVRNRLPDDQELLFAPPFLIQHHRPFPGYICFTMWETDTLPGESIDWLNQAKAVLVPTRWNAENFAKAGVRVPIEVVHLGFDHFTFHDDGSWPDVCTFGTAGALWAGGIRKNVQRMIDLFQQAFPHEEDVRLRVKITPKCELPEVNDPRIEILRSFLTPNDLCEWYRSLSCYVNGSYGEGWGLHLMEAMGCGRPLISSAATGMNEYFSEEIGWVVPHTWEPVRNEVYCGNWAVPDDESIVIAMRQVYEDPAEARRRGARAAVRSRRYTPRQVGQRFLAALMQHAEVTSCVS
jgi:glycosyltransferase involved in cell wall biosynthesis